MGQENTQSKQASSQAAVVSQPLIPSKERSSGMFSNLADFGHKRDLKGAVGFYIVYLITIILISSIAGGLGGLTGGVDSFGGGVRIGNIIAIIASLSLSFLILYKKNILSNVVFIVVALLSGVLAFLGGGLLGLIPAAFLSTK